MGKFPSFKKKVKSFLASEEGKISKDKLIKAGIIAGIGAFATLQASDVVEAKTLVECQGMVSEALNDPANWNFPYNKGSAAHTKCDVPHKNSMGVHNENGILFGRHSHAPAVHFDHYNHSSY